MGRACRESPVFEWLEYDFMLRALAATSVLSFSIAPVGAFLVLRRLSLAGEAMAHAIVPGIVIGFVIAGLSVTSMIEQRRRKIPPVHPEIRWASFEIWELARQKKLRTWSASSARISRCRRASLPGCTSGSCPG